jgi:phage/plasmid-associated DNA primase
MVIASEIPQDRGLDETFVKDVTGHTDPIVARHLYSREFTFMPVFKLILFGNHKPRIKGTDQGIWGRVHLVPFLACFEGDRMEKHLDETLDTELSGILNWVLKGCLDWQANGLQAPEAVKKATSAYKDEEDFLGQFIEDRCILGPLLKTTKKALRDAYVAWCIGEGVQFSTNKEFFSSMTERGFDGNARLGRNNARAWAGIGLKMPMETPPTDDSGPLPEDPSPLPEDPSPLPDAPNTNNFTNTTFIETPLSAVGAMDLSKVALVVLGVLADGSVRTTRSLGMSTSLPDADLRMALQELQAAGLARETPHGWVRTGGGDG